MSTRSRIGYVKPDGTIQSIYCHSDGYLEYNGKLLYEFYDTLPKVKALVALGDISSLGRLIAPVKGQPHSYDNCADGVTVAYMRDRGEKGCKSLNHATVSAWFDAAAEEYHYLFEDGKWSVWDHPGYDDTVMRQELTPVLVLAALDV